MPLFPHFYASIKLSNLQNAQKGKKMLVQRKRTKCSKKKEMLFMQIVNIRNRCGYL